MNGLLALDIGNSRIKAGLFLEDKLHAVEYLAFTDNVQDYISFWCDKYSLSALAYTNVHARPTARLFTQKQFPGLRIWEITSLTPAPIHNAYRYPAQLGTDRFVASVAARYRTPQSAILVVDIGTAITYDFTDRQGFFRGGAIAPGIDLRFRALHQFTARLPFVRWDYEKEPEIIGNETQSGILSGVVQGVMHEIAGMIRSYHAKAGEDFVTFATGGGSQALAGLLPDVINHHEPNLVLEGIYHLYKFNEQTLVG